MDKLIIFAIKSVKMRPDYENLILVIHSIVRFTSNNNNVSGCPILNGLIYLMFLCFNNISFRY